METNTKVAYYETDQIVNSRLIKVKITVNEWSSIIIAIQREHWNSFSFFFFVVLLFLFFAHRFFINRIILFASETEIDH